jgi:hypothetical protein
MEDEEEVLCDLDLDTKDTIVQAVDGVIIDGDDEEIKLLFYYIKPAQDEEIAGIIQCKCVAEFRVSRSRFLEIASDIKQAVDFNLIKVEKLGMYA